MMNGQEAYVDEDRALGFHIWVAELELLVGTAKGRSIDQVAAFELLQKVLANIQHSEVDRVREYQRRCEAALLDILTKGAAAPVRRLACQCFAQVYAVGDSVPIYSTVSTFQDLLNAKDAKLLDKAIRLGALQCLAVLCECHGQRLASSMLDTLIVATKHAARGLDTTVRAAAMRLMAKAVAGLGANDRTSLTIHTDALKWAIKAIKESPDMATPTIRTAAAGILRSLAEAEGLAFWNNISMYDEVVKLSTSLLEDENRAMADAFAGSLGELAASSHSPASQSAVKALEKKASRKSALESILKDASTTCLVTPFTDAVAQGKRYTCTALTKSWVAYISRQQMEHPGDDERLVGLAVKALEMLANTGLGPLEEGEPELGRPLCKGEVPHAQACVLYILRVGIIERLGEAGQRSMLDRLIALTASVLGSKTPLAVAALDAISLLLEVLGEIPNKQVTVLLELISTKLVSDTTCLRLQAAGVLAATAAADQSSAARLLQQHLDGLASAAGNLAGACRSGSIPATVQDRQIPGTPRGLFAAESGKLKPFMNAVHGYALASAALLVATARLPLGVPSKLPVRALDLAEDLVTAPASRQPSGQAVEREAGYILLGALCLSFPLEALLEHKQRLLQLWQPALAAESVADLDLRKYLTISQANAEVGMAMELWWRSAALEALKALLLSPLMPNAGAESERLQRRIAAMLQPTLTIVLASPVLQDPQRAKGVLGGAAALFQLRLLEVYLALPNANAFSSEHQGLSRLCTRAFRGSAAPTTAMPGVAYSAAHSTLRLLLNKQDAPLGPWVVGRGPLDDALEGFAGSPGGPHHHPWEAGFPPSSGYTGAIQQKAEHEPFPQPKSLSAALLEVQLVVLGSLLAVVSQTNQLQILDVMLAAATRPQAKAKGRENPLRRQAVLTSVCCAALAGLEALAQSPTDKVESRDAVAERAGQLAEAALAEGAIDSNVALLRSSAEMFALAACISTEAKAIGLLRSLCSSTASSSAPPRRIASALAIGCIYRSKGGIALLGMVSQVAETLIAVARASSGISHIWLLHALWLVANASGPSFIPNVKDLLDLETDLIMSEEANAVPGLRPVLGRLANAMVAVLGPEMSLGSPAYNKTRTLLLDLQNLGSEASSAEEATMAELERVLYAQMLILFAPHAVPAIAHVPLLLATLGSRQPGLRKAAADTLRHLAERDPEPILPAKIETTLFGALDSETDTRSAAQLKATIQTLLAAGAPSRPSHYLAVCSSIILAATAVANLSPNGKQSQEALQEDEDSDEEGMNGMEARRSSHLSASTSGQMPDQPEKAAATTRLRTRAFAASCLMNLPALVLSDERHFDPLLAQAEESGDWLVTQLQSLIDISFRMATGSVEALRIPGLQLLKHILHYFGDAKDPLLESSRLLEQSQAQFVAALRSSLLGTASPTLAAAGANLAADFMKSGLTQDDTAVLARLMIMLTDPLVEMQKDERELYAERIGVQAKVALLEANAICVDHLRASPDTASLSIISKAQTAHSGILLRLWTALIQDWLILCTQPPPVQAVYSPRLFNCPSPSVLATVLPFLQHAWASVLSAACSLVPPVAGGDKGGADLLSLEEFGVLLQACHMAVAEASAGDNIALVPPDRLEEVLLSIRHLLHPTSMKPSHCDLISCCDLASTVAGLVTQEKLSSAALLAAVRVVEQECVAAPDDYIRNPTLVKTLAACIAASFQAVVTREHESLILEAAAAALRAAEALLSRSSGDEKKVAEAGLVVGSLLVLQSIQKDSIIAAVSALLIHVAEAARNSIGIKASVHGVAVVAGIQYHPDGSSVLALIGCGAAENLRKQTADDALQKGCLDSDRFHTSVTFLLQVGQLLPTGSEQIEIQMLQLKESTAVLQESPQITSNSVAQEAEAAQKTSIMISADAPRSQFEAQFPSVEVEQDRRDDDGGSSPGWKEDAFQEAENPSGAASPVSQEQGREVHEAAEGNAVGLDDDAASGGEDDWGDDFQDAPTTLNSVSGTETAQEHATQEATEDQSIEEAEQAMELEDTINGNAPGLELSNPGDLEDAAEANGDLQARALASHKEPEVAKLDMCTLDSTEITSVERIAEAEAADLNTLDGKDQEDPALETRLSLKSSPVVPVLDGTEADQDSDKLEDDYHKALSPSNASVHDIQAASLDDTVMSHASGGADEWDEADFLGASSEEEVQQEHTAKAAEKPDTNSAKSPGFIMNSEEDAAKPSQGPDTHPANFSGSRMNSQEDAAKPSEEPDKNSAKPPGSRRNSQDSPEARNGETEDTEPLSDKVTEQLRDRGLGTLQQSTVSALQSTDEVLNDFSKDHHSSPEVKIARQLAIEALQSCLGPAVPATYQERVLHAFVHLLQSSNKKDAGADSWRLKCFSCLAFGSAKTVQSWVDSPSGGALTKLHLLMAKALLKLLLCGLDLTNEPDLQTKAMRLLIQVLVLYAHLAEGEHSETFKALVSQTMTLLAGGRHSAVFRSVLITLPTGMRQKLQGALQAKRNGQQQEARAAVAARAAPAIALKTFADLRMRPPPRESQAQFLQESPHISDSEDILES